MARRCRSASFKPEGSSMKRMVVTGIVLLSLSSVAEAHRLSGSATYYGGSDRLCGRRTASGGVLNCAAMTAAHRTLPFGTVLMVQSGGRSVQVTVTDRGPFTGAFLDLSPAAASALGCRCTHRNVTATIVQMGSGGTLGCGPRSSTPRRCGGHARVLPADGGRHASVGSVRILNGDGSCAPLSPSPLEPEPPIGIADDC
ncbi:rare lipoprotein A (peptidoglycan hydrolase) [Bradyrhizobium diazoefficiens]